MWLSCEDLLIIYSEVTKCNTESFLPKPLYLLLKNQHCSFFPRSRCFNGFAF